MRVIVGLILIALVFSGCEKTVSLTYKGNQSRIIIEGNITDGPGPYYVQLTRSIPLTDTGRYPGIDSVYVRIEDDHGNGETLVGLGHGLYEASSLVGVAGRAYTMTVIVADQVYKAESVMPVRVGFDSIKVEKLLVTGETEYFIIPVYADPVVKGNNYRFVMTVNGKTINQHFVQNDDVRNGVVNTLRLEINDDDLKLKKGDSVGVQMQCVDAAVALYYTTLALISDSGPGGGTTPNNPPSNISNGALGLFSAHTTEKRMVVIP
jgi:hypothetical protein